MFSNFKSIKKTTKSHNFKTEQKASPSAEMPSLSGKVSALPTEEVIAFHFGEGVGFADGRGLYDRKCPHLAEYI